VTKKTGWLFLESFNIYVNNEDIRFIQNLETPLKEADYLAIIPEIAGGSSKDFS